MSNTTAVSGTLSSTGSVSGSTKVASSGSESGNLSGAGSISTNVLTRQAHEIDDCEDWNNTGLANTNVMRWNKSDDMYKAAPRNLDGGSF